jgi:hypothetical protein
MNAPQVPDSKLILKDERLRNRATDQTGTALADEHAQVISVRNDNGVVSLWLVADIERFRRR